MTIADAIRILDSVTTEKALSEIEYYGGFYGSIAKIEAVRDACVLAVAALRDQEERRWIPVTQRLPDDGESVIVIVNGKVGNLTLDDDIEFAEFSLDEGWILEVWPEWEDPKVTYWMPSPNPPKEALHEDP